MEKSSLDILQSKCFFVFVFEELKKNTPIKVVLYFIGESQMGLEQTSK